MPERTYSEREIADLIARAAERQQDARQRDEGQGLTLGEIERIGQETGIDPEHLRAAAAEMDAAGRTLSRQSGYSRTHVTVERWIDTPLTPEAWDDTVAELQARHSVDASSWYGHNSGGTVQKVGNAYEWRHTSNMGVQTAVTASPRGGRTRLRLRQLVGLASPTAEGVGYALLPALLAAVASGAAAGSFWVAVLTLLAVWAAAAPAVTALDRRWRAGKLRDLDALADDLAPLLAAPVGVSVGDPPVAEPLPRLDLDALGDAPAAETAAGRDRQRTG